MRLKIQFVLWCIPLLGAVVLASEVLSGGGGPFLFLVVLMGVPGLWRMLARRAARAIDAAVRVGDFALARVRFDAMKGALTPTSLVTMEGTLLCAEGKFTEARALLERVPRDGSPLAVASLLNALAWVTALDGDPERGLALAEEARGNLPATAPPEYRRCMANTLGVAHVLNGDFEPGARLLCAVLELPKGAGDQGTAPFFLGEAMRRLGREAEATAFFERARREAPAFDWAQRARRGLEALDRRDHALFRPE